MERIQKSTEGYSSENIWNMGKSVFFDKGLVEKGKEAKGGKNPNKDSP